MNETLQAFLKLLEDLPSRKEFVDSFGNIVDRVKRFETALTNDFKALVATITQKADEIFAKLSSRVDDFTAQQSAKIDASIKEQENALNFIRDKARQLENGRDGKDGTNGVDGAPGKDGSPDTPEQVRDKLELLEGDARLDASAVKGLPEFQKETTRVISGGLTRMKTDSLYTKFHGGASNITVSTTPPSNPELHDLWIDIS